MMGMKPASSSLTVGQRPLGLLFLSRKVIEVVHVA